MRELDIPFWRGLLDMGSRCLASTNLSVEATITDLRHSTCGVKSRAHLRLVSGKRLSCVLRALQWRSEGTPQRAPAQLPCGTSWPGCSTMSWGRNSQWVILAAVPSQHYSPHWRGLPAPKEAPSPRDIDADTCSTALRNVSAAGVESRSQDAPAEGSS